MAVDDRCCPHSLVNLRSVSVDFIMWSLSIEILSEFGLSLFSCDHAFADPFNEAVSFRFVFMCSWREGWCPQGADRFYVNLCRSHGFLYFETNGFCRGSGHSSLPFGLGRYRSLVVGSNSCSAWCAGCQCRHEFSDSNSWTTSTDVPPKELRWPPCTYWRLGWCKMPRVPVLAQRCGCCQVVVNWNWMLCHTQYIRNQACNEQWSGTASAVCLCPLPTSSVQPLGWDWEPPCTESLVHWCALWRRGANPTTARGIAWDQWTHGARRGTRGGTAQDPDNASPSRHWNARAPSWYSSPSSPCWPAGDAAPPTTQLLSHAVWEGPCRLCPHQHEETGSAYRGTSTTPSSWPGGAQVGCLAIALSREKALGCWPFVGPVATHQQHSLATFQLACHVPQSASVRATGCGSRHGLRWL